jgi:drug/metabolite transporter (DMT)-like permease
VRPAPTPSSLAFAFLVVVGSVLAYPALVWLLHRVPTSTVATCAYVDPVFALGLGWLLVDQTVPAVARRRGGGALQRRRVQPLVGSG